MTDDQHGEGTPQGGGRWNPLPQGDYDDGATAFVQLPEGGIDALLTGDSPLAAPGHGYVPPPITATHTDGTAGWPAPGGGQWPDPNAAPASSHAADDRFTYEPGATQQWTFEEPAAPAAPGHDVTGQWSIPVAGGELPDESGEYTTSSLVEQWGGTPPATLPGGAPAPWAAPRPWDTPDPTATHPSDPAPETYAPETGYGHGPAPHGEGYGGGYGEGAGHGVTGYADAGPAEDAREGAVPADAGYSDGGHPGSGHEGAAGHSGAGYPDAEHGRAAAPAHAGHVDATDGDTPGEPAVPAPSPTGPGTAPEADAHGLAEAPERPAEAPSDHEQPTEPASAPEPATGAATASPEALGDPGHPVTTADPAAPADTPGTGHADTPTGAAHSAADPAVAPEPGADPAAAEQPAAHPAEPAGTAAADATGATDAVETAEQPAEAAVPEAAVPEAAAPPVPAEPAEAPAATEPSEDDGAADNAPPAPETRENPETGETREPVPDGAEEPPATPLPPHDDHPLASYVLRVNGSDRPVTDAWIGESLLYVLRERLGLAGAKDGCSQGECGACNVQVDGRLVASCLVPAVTTAGSEVRTVEGLAADGRPSDVQRALARCGAVQCGFCVPGMAMTVHDLLEGNPAPTELETRQALCGNLCRCSGYRGVLEAVKEVVAEREASHAGHETDADEARIPHQAAPGSGGVHPSAFEAPGAFAAPRPPERYDTPDPYGATPPGPQDQQHYGQDGGQA
ncbi:2Fe-2S iron-sulfur cluster-binding protein [Streptomyces rubradiris]|uniref:(2Fe-2S)-binding protein n=1 Tax=Streptomyces rubradiris TaxID=285531 RepID=UPI0036E6FF75